MLVMSAAIGIVLVEVEEAAGEVRISVTMGEGYGDFKSVHRQIRVVLYERAPLGILYSVVIQPIEPAKRQEPYERL